MKVNMINQYLKQTQDHFRIKGKELAEAAGISPQHLSEYRRGKCDITSSKLWDAVCAMDRLAPGARAYFCGLMAGKKYPEISLQELVDDADDAEIEELLLALGRKWRERDRDRNHKKEAILRV